MIALALFAGLHGPRAGRALLFALPAARLAGCLNGTELATTRSSPLAAAGAAAALFVAVSLVTGQIASLRAAWARIAVQVAGSWIAAIGLFVLGWAVRGR